MMSKEPYHAPDEGPHKFSMDHMRPSLESERLDDVEYTKDEELEKLKRFFNRVFHRTPKHKHKSSASPSAEDVNPEAADTNA